MRFAVVTILLTAACSTLLLGVAGAQTYPVKAKFEVDGKESRQRFRVLIYAEGGLIEPDVSENGEFYVPVSDIEWADVRLVSAEHDLLYKHVYLKKLQGNLVFGVRENISGEATTCEAGSRLMALYYLVFHPDDAEGTRMDVQVCK